MAALDPHVQPSLIRRDFKQTLRYKTTLVLVGLGLLFTYATLRQYGIGGPHGTDTPFILDALGGDTTLAAAQSVVSPFVLIAGLIVGYPALAGERNRSLILTVSMPHNRASVLAGKVLARSLVVLLLTAIPVLVVLVAGSAWYGIPSPVRAVAFLAVTVGYAVSCVAIGVGISAVVRSSAVATVLAFLLLFVTLLWETFLSQSIYSSLTGSDVPPANTATQTPQTGYLVFQRLVPDAHYSAVTNAIIGAPNSSWNAGPTVWSSEPTHSTLYLFIVDDLFESTPWYLASELSLLGLVAWGAIPLGLGYLRFRREDIR